MRVPNRRYDWRPIDEAPRSLRTFVVEPSNLEPLRRDQESARHRGWHSTQPGSPPVFLLVRTSARLPLETLTKIGHEYSLRDERDSARAVRLVALSEQGGRTTLILKDPGSETLDQSPSSAGGDDAVLAWRHCFCNGTERGDKWGPIRTLKGEKRWLFLHSLDPVIASRLFLNTCPQ